MKNKFFSVIALMVISFAPISVADAKPAYCATALTQCVSQCGGGAFGLLCSSGCGIGYLMCGTD